MANLVWANICISGYVVHNSIELLHAAHTCFILVCVHNWHAYIGMQYARDKVFFIAGEH